MAGLDRTAAREETIGESAQGEHLKSLALDTQCTGLSDRFGAPLEHCDAHVRQGQFAGEPQPDGTGANNHHIKFIAQEILLHLSAT